MREFRETDLEGGPARIVRLQQQRALKHPPPVPSAAAVHERRAVVGVAGTRRQPEPHLQMDAAMVSSREVLG